MAWFLVILGKDGGEKEGIKQREEKGEMPLIYLLEKHIKKEEERETERSTEKREQRDKGEEEKGGRWDQGAGLCSGLRGTGGACQGEELAGGDLIYRPLRLWTLRT